MTLGSWWLGFSSEGGISKWISGTHCSLEHKWAVSAFSQKFRTPRPRSRLSLIKDTVTPEMLRSSLKTLVGDSSHGEGLAPGRLAFIADKDRPLPYSVTRARQSRRRCSLSSSIPSGLHPTPADYAVCTSGAPMGRVHNQEPRDLGVYFIVELVVQ